jgi:DNA-directed RNA polymerase specialized sigma24 family protein
MANQPEHAGYFSTTHWSLVVQAGDRADRAAQSALETLCRRYWFPLYAFVRREGYGTHDSQDLTQAFFARFLEKDYLHQADPSRGRFRSFLLASLRHFLANAHDHGKAAKRGGGGMVLPFDYSQAEDRYLHEPATEWTAEKLFYRRWALELLQAVMDRLRAQWATGEKDAFFLAVQPFLSGAAPTRTYAEVAHELETTEGAVKTAVHRLRRRYRELLREEIAQTVTEPGQIDEEIQQLFGALQGK